MDTFPTCLLSRAEVRNLKKSNKNQNLKHLLQALKGQLSTSMNAQHPEPEIQVKEKSIQGILHTVISGRAGG